MQQNGDAHTAVAEWSVDILSVAYLVALVPLSCFQCSASLPQTWREEEAKRTFCLAEDRVCMTTHRGVMDHKPACKLHGSSWGPRLRNRVPGTRKWGWESECSFRHLRTWKRWAVQGICALLEGSRTWKLNVNSSPRLMWAWKWLIGLAGSKHLWINFEATSGTEDTPWNYLGESIACFIGRGLAAVSWVSHSKPIVNVKIKKKEDKKYFIFMKLIFACKSWKWETIKRGRLEPEY